MSLRQKCRKMSDDAVPITRASRRTKSVLSLGDREALALLARSLDKFEKVSGTLPQGAHKSVHKYNAATILSSWVLGMSRARCAQRLLDWWSVDTKVKFIDLSAADEITRKRVVGLARHGYMTLQKIEKSRIG